MSEHALQLIAENKKTHNKSLDLGRCGLREIPKEVLELTWLEELNFCNRWYEWMDGVYQEFRSINKGAPNFIESTLDLGPLLHLKKLTFGGASGQKWPVQKLDFVKNVHYLYICYCEVSDISALKEIKSLTSLYFSSNQVSDISALKEIKSLTSLNFSSNQVSDISALKEIKSLTSLNFSANQVSDISALKEIKSLTSLYFWNNKVSDISALKEIKSLTSLDFSENQVSDISALFSLVASVEDFDLECSGNPLPKRLLERANNGSAALKSYIIELDRKEKEKSIIHQLPEFVNNEVKLILVGNSTAGKSTLAHYLMTEEVVKEGIHSTPWLEKRTWEFDSNTRVHIYDFGGQEFYHETHHIFFSSDTAYLLLWDHDGNRLECRDTEIIIKGERKNLPIQNYPIEYWLDAIDHYSAPVKKMLTPQANLLSEDSIRENELSRPVKDEFSPSHNIKAGHKNTEAVDKRDYSFEAVIVQNKMELHQVQPVNLSTLKEEFPFVKENIAISLYDKRRLHLLNEVVTEMINKVGILGYKGAYSYQVIKKSIEKLQSDPNAANPIMNIQEFITWCNDQLCVDDHLIKELKPKARRLTLAALRELVFNENVVRSMAYLFSTTGSIFYFPNNPTLKDNVYLKPLEIIEIIHGILERAGQNKGYVLKSEIESSIAKRENYDVDTITQLMQEFKIVFSHPYEKDVWIAPLYLTEQPLKGVELFLQQIQKPIKRFTFKRYIHKSIILDIFHKFGTKVYRDEDSEPYFWRNGLVVGTGHNLVIIRFFLGKEQRDDEGKLISFEPSRIDVFQASGESASDFTKKILEEIETTCLGWKYDMMVTTNGDEFFSIQELEDHQKKNEFILYKNGKEFKLRDFHEYLPGIPRLYRLFISYSSNDTATMKRLATHLEPLRKSGDIEMWYDHKIEPGTKWNNAIHQEMEKADVFVMLLSADFVASDYITAHEIPFALKKMESGKAHIFPIIVSDCLWELAIPQLQQLKDFKEAEDKTSQKPEISLIDKNDQEKSLHQAVLTLKNLMQSWPMRR
jgi:internalin A